MDVADRDGLALDLFTFQAFHRQLRLRQQRFDLALLEVAPCARLQSAQGEVTDSDARDFLDEEALHLEVSLEVDRGAAAEHDLHARLARHLLSDADREGANHTAAELGALREA